MGKCVCFLDILLQMANFAPKHFCENLKRLRVPRRMIEHGNDESYIIFRLRHQEQQGRNDCQSYVFVAAEMSSLSFKLLSRYKHWTPEANHQQNQGQVSFDTNAPKTWKLHRQR